MGLDRTTIRKGPAKVSFDSGEFFAESGINVTLDMEKESRAVDAFGVVSELVVGKTVTLTMTAVQWTSLAALFPNASLNVGEDIYGAADTTCTITPVNGKPITLSNAAVTSPPDILLSGSGSQFGEITITALIANSADAGALASYLSFAADATGAALTGLDRTKILNAAYTATFDGTTYHSAEGFTISFDLQLSENRVDGLGIVGMAIQDLVATCTFIPVGGGDEEAFANLVGFATGIGREPERSALTVEGSQPGDPSVVLNNCVVNPGGYVYGSDAYRQSAFTWRTARSETGGVIDELFTVGEVPTP